MHFRQHHVADTFVMLSKFHSMYSIAILENMNLQFTLIHHNRKRTKSALAESFDNFYSQNLPDVNANVGNNSILSKLVKTRLC